MPREKFLKQVADYYISKGTDMTHTTFVFPNKRSAVFMHKYMKTQSAIPMFKPHMVSITYFTQHFSGRASASDTELVFILYKQYCRLLQERGLNDQIYDFDRFYFWGSIILKDFNDIDAYFVNHKELYDNLKATHELRANYLTPEQVEVIRYLFGADFKLPDEDVFWMHTREAAKKGSETSTKFLNLWEILGPLYEYFTAALAERDTPIAYTGLQSRLAYENIKERTAESFNGMRYVFVGFNILSSARTLIFKRLKDLGIADFFWDIASPMIAGDDANMAIDRFLRPLVKKLPMPDDFELEPIAPCDDIEVISVPSAVGQTKVAAEILNDWASEWKKSGDAEALSPDALVNTAVVLADKELLMPMLYSIAPEISSVNVTMAISYASTPFAALMSSIISLHLRARKTQMTYYYSDVIDVLSHQYIAMIEPQISASIKDKIIKEHIYTISSKQICTEYPELEFIFRQIPNEGNVDDVRSYIDNLVNTLRARLSKVMPKGHGKTYYELCVLDGYTKAVADLFGLIKQYGIGMKEHTFLQMIERTLMLTPINFAGQPLKGLQIMGMMDTRTLDFDNVIMLSMNDRTFPGRDTNPSMIPINLRVAYHMPSPEHEESTNAYQFYRLISRAQRVRLIYDSRSGGTGNSGEMSRYLSQLIYMYPQLHVKQRTVEFKAESSEVLPIVVNKTPEVIAQLKRFRQGGDLRLSASAIKTYLSCPLKFYLQYVRNLRVNDDELEYIDAASYGSVIHELVRNLYESRARSADGSAIEVNNHTLDIMINDNIEQRALQILNAKYYNGRYSDLSQIPGEGKLISKVIAEYVKYMLMSEKKLTPYSFVAAEFGEHKSQLWRINDKYTLNFTMSVDRIDRFRNPGSQDVTYRFIDYKTGGDQLTAKSLDEIFENSDCGGMFQLLLYSHAYKALYNGGNDIKIEPVIYKFQTIPTKGIEPLKFNKKPIRDYLDVDVGADVTFYERFEALIDHIFEEDNQWPFCQTDNADHCKYCPFANMCGRYPQENKF